VTVEIIIPNQITSAILTQVIEPVMDISQCHFDVLLFMLALPSLSSCAVQTLCHPNIIDLISELMVHGEGSEIYILDIEQLGFKVNLEGGSQG
jgi:hypothetical protein